MSPEKQRIAIAEACGWEQNSKQCAFNPIPHRWFNKNDSCCYEQCPDYCNDLNAAVSLCGKLAKQGWNCALDNGLDTTWECTFYRRATKDTNPDNITERNNEKTEEHFACGKTLGLAICKAFLRTIGKWEE